MMTDALGDLITQTLRKEGFSDTLDDMMVSWLKTTGASGNSQNDLWMSYLRLQGAAGVERNSMEFSWLGLLGHGEKSLNERQVSYWKARLALP